jgi:hypothetical protein
VEGAQMGEGEDLALRPVELPAQRPLVGLWRAVDARPAPEHPHSPWAALLGMASDHQRGKTMITADDLPFDRATMERLIREHCAPETQAEILSDLADMSDAEIADSAAILAASIIVGLDG